MTMPGDMNMQGDNRDRETAERRQQIDQSEGLRVHQHLSSYARVVIVWQGFANNLIGLLNQCEHDEKMKADAVRGMESTDPRDPVINALDSNLVAYTAGVGALVDQTRSLVSKWGDKKVKDEFEQRKKQLEQTVPGATFIIKLRNYLLHYVAAPWALSLRYATDGNGWQETTIQVQLVRDHLLEMDNWTKPVRVFLEAQASAIDIRPLVEAFTDAEAELAAWVHNAIRELRAPEIDATNDLIRRCNLAMTDGAHDGSDWESFYTRPLKNARRKVAGKSQEGWRRPR